MSQRLEETEEECSLEPGQLKVLWAIKGLGAGGAERLLLLSARYRDPAISAHVVYLLGHKTALVEEMAEEGVESTSLNAGRLWSLGWLWRFRRLILRQRPDVVHAHSPVVASATRLVLLTIPVAHRPRLVVTYHSLWHGQVLATQIADALTSSLDDARIAVSSAVASSMPARLRRGVEVVLHGVETEHLVDTRGERERVRRELGFGDDDVVVGTVANLRVVKGYTDLLAAASALVQRYPNVSFLSVGQGPQEAEFRHLHRDLGLGDRFRFLGYREDVLELMTSFDVFCLASRHEGLPVALMEAVALGLPVVATHVGGIPEAVTHNREALLISPKDPGALTDALATLIVDSRQRETMANNATERAGTLSVSRAVRRTESLYRALVAP